MQTNLKYILAHVYAYVKMEKWKDFHQTSRRGKLDRSHRFGFEMVVRD